MPRRFESHGATRLSPCVCGRQQAALLQHVLHLLDVVRAVIDFFIIRIDIGIARDREDRAVDDRIVHEDLVEVRLDELLLQHVAHAVAGREQEARQRRRERYHAERDVALVLEERADKQFLVLEMRERMMQVDDLRRKHGQQLLAEILLEILPLLEPHIVDVEVHDALRFQLLLELLVNVVALLVEARHLGENGRELLPRRHAAFVFQFVRLDAFQIEQAADAHHEELVEVAREDFDELHALEERHVGIHRLVEHALVETQPRQLAVLRVARVDAGAGIAMDVHHLRLAVIVIIVIHEHAQFPADVPHTHSPSCVAAAGSAAGCPPASSSGDGSSFFST